jgi:uncharacterized membrane protein
LTPPGSYSIYAGKCELAFTSSGLDPKPRLETDTKEPFMTERYFRLMLPGLALALLLLCVPKTACAQYNQGLGPGGSRLTPPPNTPSSGPYNQGLGPGGQRLTPPPAPSPAPGLNSSTGFGPNSNTGFGPNTGLGPNSNSGGGSGYGSNSRGTSPPSSAGLQICNDSGKSAAVALGYSPDPSSWESRGWFLIPNGTCSTLIARLTGRDYFYHYALYSDVTGVWMDYQDGGDRPFCVHLERRFANRDSGDDPQCADTSHRQVLFTRIDTGGRQSHTVRLKPF